MSAANWGFHYQPRFDRGRSLRRGRHPSRVLTDPRAKSRSQGRVIMNLAGRRRSPTAIGVHSHTDLDYPGVRWIDANHPQAGEQPRTTSRCRPRLHVGTMGLRAVVSYFVQLGSPDYTGWCNIDDWRIGRAREVLSPIEPVAVQARSSLSAIPMPRKATRIGSNAIDTDPSLTGDFDFIRHKNPTPRRPHWKCLTLRARNRAGPGRSKRFLTYIRLPRPSSAPHARHAISPTIPTSIAPCRDCFPSFWRSYDCCID